MTQFFASFDNREVAAALWLLVAIVGAAMNTTIRVSMVGLLRVFFARQILIGVVFLFTYIGVIVFLLERVGIWAPSQLKLTLLWLCTAGLLGLFSAPKVSENPELISRAARDTFQITMVFEFFVNLYRMPLAAELVFVPFAVFLGAMIAVSELNEDHGSVNKFLNSVAMVLGLALLAYAGWKTLDDLSTIANVETARSFVLPILFSVLLLPFVWLVAVYCAYESVFVRLQFLVKDKSLHPYIKRSLLLKYRGNIRYLRAWFQAAWFRTFATRKDVDESIRTLFDGVSAL